MLGLQPSIQDLGAWTIEPHSIHGVCGVFLAWNPLVPAIGAKSLSVLGSDHS